jgi:hypothetical protein
MNLCKHGKPKYQDDYAQFCEKCRKNALAEIDDKIKEMATYSWKVISKASLELPASWRQIMNTKELDDWCERQAKAVVDSFRSLEKQNDGVLIALMRDALFYASVRASSKPPAATQE